MKNKILNLVVIIILFVACLIMFKTTTYAGSQTLDNLTYDVQLNSDGSANITETWEIYVNSTNTLFKTFELNNSKYGKITNVTVKEIFKDGVTSDFIKTDTYAYHVDKGYYYALQTKSNEFEIAWGVSINNSENKVYQIKYTVTDAIKTYDDCSEFYWQFIGDSNGIPADKVEGTIKLPKPISNKENLKIWAHGPLQGEIRAIDNETIKFELKHLITETMVETRIVTTEPIFTINTNILKTEMLEKIIQEETKWANEANAKREQMKQQEEKEEIIIGIIISCIIVVSIGILIYIIFKIIKYGKELLKIKKIKPEQEIEYLRDIPDENSTPTEAAYLYYFDKKSAFKNNLSKIVSALILNLALKKVITFEKDEKNKINIIINKDIDTSKLRKDELTLYDLLKRVEIYNNKKSKTEENIKSISMKDIEKYAKNNDVTFLSKIEGLEEIAKFMEESKGNYSKEQIKISDKWANKKNIYYVMTFICLTFAMFIIPMFLVIPFLTCGIICHLLQNKTRTLTQQGINEQEKWKALKRFMENFSLIDEREVPELALWEKYLVYATAFGIADKVLKQLKLKFPELNDDQYMINSNYTYLYMMNRYNFDKILTSSMQKAYYEGIRERAARQAAASSSYSSGSGGGGGFSRRGRPAEEAGGRNGRKIIKRLKFSI